MLAVLIGQAVEGDGVVEILRVVGVDGDGEFVGEVFAGGEFFFDVEGLGGGRTAARTSAGNSVGN